MATPDGMPRYAMSRRNLVEMVSMLQYYITGRQNWEIILKAEPSM